MNEVGCSVDKCVYNDERCCCRTGITVEGDHAENKDDTYCGNYEMRNDGCCHSKNGMNEPSRHTNIKCDVRTCRYNNDYACMADDIDIVFGSGETGQTECASFEVK